MMMIFYLFLQKQGLRGGQHLRAYREKSKCKDCGGQGICQHNRIRSRCNEYGGAGICEHNR